MVSEDPHAASMLAKIENETSMIAHPVEIWHEWWTYVQLWFTMQSLFVAVVQTKNSLITVRCYSTNTERYRYGDL